MTIVHRLRFVTHAALLTVSALLGNSAGAADLLVSWNAARSHDASFAAASATLGAALEKISQGDALLSSRVDLQADATQACEDFRSGDSAIKSSSLQQGQRVGDRCVAQASSANPTVRLLALGLDIAHRNIDQYRRSAVPVLAVVASLE